MTDRYLETYHRSMVDPSGFWLEAAERIDWQRKPATAIDGAAWFPDGQLNVCFNAVDRHVAAGRGAHRALIYDSPVTGVVRTYNFAELQIEVARIAGMLVTMGTAVGDRVLIYMPMIPEAVFAMLACARIGAIHSVVFGGFAAPELAKRIDDAEPTIILTASCGIERSRLILYKPLLDEAIAKARHKPSFCIVFQRPEAHASLVAGRDIDWALLRAESVPVECVSVIATHPLYILYTSGTTGVPKGVVHGHGGYAVALAWSMERVFGAKPGDTFWAASDLGWAVGHSYIVYAPLLHGCATVLYEGKPVGTPNASAYWRVIRQHKVDVFFTAPTAVRAIRREDPDGIHCAEGIGQLRAMFLAGERADPDTLNWAANQLRIPVVDHWWQTELGWPALATSLGLGQTDILIGSAGRAVPGYRFAVLDASHTELPAGEIGEIVIALPLPPGCLLTLWRNEQGYKAAYLERHPGYYCTGDAGFFDAEGRAHVMSRIDDIINVAGHRIATGSLEQIVASHPAISECAVVGVADSLKGTLPVAFVVRKVNATVDDDRLVAEIISLIRNEFGPVASFRTAVVVTALPKTRSGKILRSTIRDLADGRNPVVPATIEDPSVVDELRKVVAALN